MNNIDHLRRLASIETDACVLWDRGRSGRYGAIRSAQRCHRLVCVWYHGEPTEGMHAAHACGNSLCVNPRHLRWATPAENIADKARHGTVLKGARHHQAKLTPEQVAMIRDSPGSLREVAELVGISKSQAWRVRRGENWRDA